MKSTHQTENELLIEDNEISLKEIFFIIKKYKVLIFTTTVIFLLITIIYTFLQKPVYQTTGMIMIVDPSSKVDLFEMELGSEKKYLENEIEILRSRTTANRAINKLLKLDSRNTLFLFGTKKYEFEGIARILNNLFFFNSEENNLTNPQIESEVSDSLFNIFVSRLRNNLIIKAQRDTDMLNISVLSVDPEESALLVNKVIDVYREIDLDWATGEMSHLKEFLIEQINKKEIELIESENSLKNFQEEDKIFGIDNNSKLLLQNLLNTESLLYGSKAEYNIVNERKKYIQSQLTGEEQKLIHNVLNTINNRMFALKNEVALKESELISAISQQGNDHEIVKTIGTKLDKLKETLKLETRELISQGISVADPIKFRQSLMDSVINLTAKSAMLETKINEFDKLVSKYELQLTGLPKKVLKFTRLSRNLNIDEETYSLMRHKLEEAQINEASKIGKVRIVDKAISDDAAKIKPNKKLNILLGLLMGLGFGASISFIRNYFDSTIKSIEYLEKRNLIILALIPSIGKSRDNKNRKTKKYQIKMGNAEKIQRRLITHEDPKSPISEAYRSLRTSLMYTEKENKQSDVILVSSSGPGEGKTTTIVNLAIAYANLGKKTILLDTDLRKPVTHKIFSIAQSPGITKYLSGIEEDVSNVTYKTEIKNLSLIPCGVIPPNPSEMLESKRMKILIEKLRKEYDIILLDSPPLLAVTDSFVCMKYVDQFILIVRSSQTQKGGLNRSLDQIRLTNSPLTGVVVNDIDESNAYGAGYYYNYYQYYYNEEKSK